MNILAAPYVGYYLVEAYWFNKKHLCCVLKFQNSGSCFLKEEDIKKSLHNTEHFDYHMAEALRGIKNHFCLRTVN